MTSHTRLSRRARVASTATVATIATALFAFAGPAHAAAPAKVHLATAGEYSVLASSTVTNTGGSVLAGSLGLSPGTAITGFPPGVVTPPSTTNATNAAAASARADLTAAYVDAHGRPIDATTAADLANLHLQAGVYAGPSKGALQLTGPLVLDGAGDPNAVFVFQTDSSLTTASSSTVSLINGAQECNVFWQVGSSATLGSGSVFAGNIMALTSVSIDSGVTVHGRALARNGAVTLLDDVFTKPTCATSLPGSTTTTTAGSSRSTAPGSGSTTVPGATTVPGGSGTSATGSTVAARNGAADIAGPPRTDATPLPSRNPWRSLPLVGSAVALLTALGVGFGRRAHRT